MSKFALIEPDNETYAKLSGRFTEYNAAHSTWNTQTYCIVHRINERIVAGGRGIVNMGALNK